MSFQGPSSKAVRAAWMARLASSRSAFATSPMGCSVAGSVVVKVSPEAESTYSPSMKSW
jgi:hypothetical protein